MNPCIERPIGLLRLVFEVDLGKRQTHGLRPRLATGVAICDTGNDNVIQLDDEVLLLALARLSMRDGRVLQVRARRTRLHERGRRLVDIVNDGKILEGRLARATTTTRSRGTRVRYTPREREHLDFVFVFVVERFPFDVPNLCKDV